MWNISFLGMGMGPVIAAGLVHVEFTVGDFQVNQSTNPGWFYAIVWLFFAAMLPFVPEPQRRFQPPCEPPSSDCESGLHSSDGKHATWTDSLMRWWCVTAVFLSSIALAVWETGAAVVTQKYFGWSVQTSSLFIGAIFLMGLCCGELVRAVKHRFLEANLVIGGLALMLVGSCMLHWVKPLESGASTGQITLTEVPYIIGSFFVLNAANTNRTFSGTIASRAALSTGGVTLQTQTSIACSRAVTAGRSLGGILGMGLASVPGGPHWTAGLLTAVAAVNILGLCIPKLPGALRES